MGKGLIAALFALSFSPSLLAQTVADFQKSYSHHEVYEVRSGVQMAARFAANGKVCEIRLEPTYFGKDKVDLRFGISDVESLLDDIIPPSERGKPDKKQRNNPPWASDWAKLLKKYGHIRTLECISFRAMTRLSLTSFGSIASANSVDKSRWRSPTWVSVCSQMGADHSRRKSFAFSVRSARFLSLINRSFRELIEV